MPTPRRLISSLTVVTLLVGLLGASAFSSHPAGATPAAPVLTPYAIADSPQGMVDLTAVSCPPGGQCVAVGNLSEPTPAGSPMVATGVAGSWSYAALPVPAAMTNTPVMSSVVCPAVGDCVAAGSSSNASGGAMLATESNGSWTSVFLPIYVTGVACVGVGNCVAVGVADPLGPPGTHAVVATDSNGTWTVSAVAPPAGVNAADVSLNSVACSGGSCFAMGQDNPSTGPSQAIAAVQSNGSWIAEVINVPLYTSAPSCPGAGPCTVIGVDQGGPFAVTGSFTTWSAPQSLPLPPGTTNTEGQAGSLSCTSANDCTGLISPIVGCGEGVCLQQAFVEFESAGSWGAVSPPVPADADNSDGPAGELAAVSCGSTVFCVAVGQYATSSTSESAYDEVISRLPVDRIAGQDAIATSIATSQAEFPTAGSASAVVLARADFFSDALAGGPLAAQKGGPLLITPGASQSSSLDPRVLTEIKRVLPTGDTVYFLGGDLALDPSIDTTLTGLGYQVQRVAGADEYETAVDIAKALGDPATVFEATGLNFADALSAVPAAIQAHGAILLTDGTTQAPVTAAYLSAHPGDTRYAIGGPLAAAGADPSATAIYGNDLYDTSAAVAATFFLGAKTFGAATGVTFPDALSGGVFMGQPGTLGPVLLVPPSGPLSGSTSLFLAWDAPVLTQGYLFGGPLAVGDDVLAELAAT